MQVEADRERRVLRKCENSVVQRLPFGLEMGAEEGRFVELGLVGGEGLG